MRESSNILVGEVETRYRKLKIQIYYNASTHKHRAVVDNIPIEAEAYGEVFERVNDMMGQAELVPVIRVLYAQSRVRVISTKLACTPEGIWETNERNVPSEMVSRIPLGKVGLPLTSNIMAGLATYYACTPEVITEWQEIEGWIGRFHENLRAKMKERVPVTLDSLLLAAERTE